MRSPFGKQKSGVGSSVVFVYTVCLEALLAYIMCMHYFHEDLSKKTPLLFKDRLVRQISEIISR